MRIRLGSTTDLNLGDKIILYCDYGYRVTHIAFKTDRFILCIEMFAIMTAETTRRIADLLGYLLPLYKREGKSYLSIGVGCTGGRHRSVMVAESLAKALSSDGIEVSVLHRDVRK